MKASNTLYPCFVVLYPLSRPIMCTVNISFQMQHAVRRPFVENWLRQLREGKAHTCPNMAEVRAVLPYPLVQQFVRPQITPGLQVGPARPGPSARGRGGAHRMRWPGATRRCLAWRETRPGGFVLRRAGRIALAVDRQTARDRPCSRIALAVRRSEPESGLCESEAQTLGLRVEHGGRHGGRPVRARGRPDGWRGGETAHPSARPRRPAPQRHITNSAGRRTAHCRLAGRVGASDRRRQPHQPAGPGWAGSDQPGRAGRGGRRRCAGRASGRAGGVVRLSSKATEEKTVRVFAYREGREIEERRRD
jgi:hypothetical protein